MSTIASSAAAGSAVSIPPSNIPFPSPSQLQFLSCRDLVKRISISRAQIYRMVGEGAFPRPVRVHGARIAWLVHEVDAWMVGRVAARDAAGAP